MHPERSPGLNVYRQQSVGTLVKPETDLQRHLKVETVLVVDSAPDIADLEPVEVVQGLRGAADGPPNRIVNALAGRADDLADRVDAVGHRCPLSPYRLAASHPSRPGP